MKSNQIQRTVNQTLLSQLRQAFSEEGEITKNVTFSLSDDVIQKIEEISKSNKLLEDKYGVSGLPTTKSDILSNAIETYSNGYFAALNNLELEFDGENLIESGEKNSNTDSPLSADTLIAAGHVDGFNEVFLNNHEWYEVRMASWRLQHLKYLGIYVSAPVSKVTHYAPIESFQVLKNKKYKFKLGEPIRLEQPIELSEYDLVGVRQTLYTTLKHLKKSKHLYQLSDWWRE
ncbi:hypothetical protein ABET23_03610 [Bacillus wiedmannii]|uniref:hypothetical protein n=1 Tax=Bacillus wiedmannii TaxID=1890302 RepID=UPI000BF54FB0|nr:hypothetical protein CN317_00880 [Bacillus cereus]